MGRKKREKKARQSLDKLMKGTLDSPHMEPRDRWLQVRVSATEREEIQQIASELGLNVSEYVRNMHKVMAAQQRKKKGK